MSSLYVAVNLRKNGPHEPLTGIPRVEYEIARELEARGGHVLRYDPLLGRFRVTPLENGRTRAAPAKAPPAMGDGDTIVVPAILWRQGHIDDLARKRQANKVRLGVYVHDIMPIRRPELVSNENGAMDFRRFIDAMVDCADWMCTSSRFVSQDLCAYVHETGKRSIPVHHVPLCADLKDRVEADFTNRLRGLNLPDDGYALYVSTLNPRKNHTGMYWLWRRLVAEMGDATPPLVLAGQRGWNDRDIFDLMSRDRQMWDRHIRFVDGPSDAELVHLYRHCAYTVFPSFHEGWGLPVTESLSFGKPCIAANNTSLREAGQGLATHVDDLDGAGWLAAIKRMTLDTQYRRDCSTMIAERYQQRTWHDVGEDIVRLSNGHA